mmetsp:Transcript_26622/g.32277  ORF Transcript_26622/g.32277 Transcript_26622/m.32277 type:complete len:142 (+) Transcript_26622:133-558(+)
MLQLIAPQKHIREPKTPTAIPLDISNTQTVPPLTPTATNCPYTCKHSHNHCLYAWASGPPHYATIAPPLYLILPIYGWHNRMTPTRETASSKPIEIEIAHVVKFNIALNRIASFTSSTSMSLAKCVSSHGGVATVRVIGHK